VDNAERINASLNSDLNELILEFNKRSCSRRIVLENVDHTLLIESSSKPTIYDLRVLFTIMASQTGSGQLRSICNEIVKTLAKMEMYKIANPRVPKLQNPSPPAFGF